MPRGGWLREVRRWACCGLRRTGGPSPELWGVFIIAVHPCLCAGFGGPASRYCEAVRGWLDVCDSVRLLYLLTY